MPLSKSLWKINIAGADLSTRLNHSELTMQSVSTDENHDDDDDDCDDDNGDYDDDGGGDDDNDDDDDCVCDDESFRANYLREHRREWLQD